MTFPSVFLTVHFFFLDLSFCFLFFTERGFCVLGDLCQFDHGNDPLVVDEVSLPSMIPFPPPPGLPPPGILLPPIPAPAHNMRMPVPRPLTQPPPAVHSAPSK